MLKAMIASSHSAKRLSLVNSCKFLCLEVQSGGIPSLLSRAGRAGNCHVFIIPRPRVDECNGDISTVTACYSSEDWHNFPSLISKVSVCSVLRQTFPSFRLFVSQRHRIGRPSTTSSCSATCRRSLSIARTVIRLLPRTVGCPCQSGVKLAWRTIFKYGRPT